MSFFSSTGAAGGFGARPGGAATTASKITGEQDQEVTPGPSDTVSALSFSPTADFLAVGSWDNHVRIYRVDKTSAQPVSPWQQYTHEAPVLDVCWSGDGAKVISVGADKVARCFDMNTNTPTVVGQHDQPIRSVRWSNACGGVLITAGWDKVLKIWKLDPQPQQVHSLPLPERCFGMDVCANNVVVAMAERMVLAFRIEETGTITPLSVSRAPHLSSRSNTLLTFTRLDSCAQEHQSPLKYQTRSVAALPDGDGYALGGVEGRVAVQYFHDPPDKDGKV